MRYAAYCLPLLCASCPAEAEGPTQADTSSVTISGSAAMVSQYRFRGISQSDEDLAVQAGVTASHASGFYAGSWGSNLAGFGSYGGANLEVDVFGGFKHEIASGVTVDAGLLWYLYPGTHSHDYAEPYASISGVAGPVGLKAGAAYAPKQDEIGDADSLYVFGEASAPIPGTPITLKSHLGYTTGKGAAPAGPDGHYLDWMVGADITWKALTFNVSYVDTDIGRAAADNFYTSGGTAGRSIVDGAVLFSLTAAF